MASFADLGRRTGFLSWISADIWLTTPGKRDVIPLLGNITHHSPKAAPNNTYEQDCSRAISKYKVIIDTARELLNRPASRTTTRNLQKRNRSAIETSRSKVNLGAKPKTGPRKLLQIYTGPMLLSIGPFLMSLSTFKLTGDGKAAGLAIGLLLSSIALFSTALKKAAVLRLAADAEKDIQNFMKNGNFRAADQLRFVITANWLSYIIACLVNIVVGSWVAFHGNPGWAVGNVVPELLGLSMGVQLCIIKGHEIGRELFPHSVAPNETFDKLTNEDYETRHEGRLSLDETIEGMSRWPGYAILGYACLSIAVHLALVLSNPKGRKGSEAYIDLSAVPAIGNFIAAAYFMMRIMQQMVPNYVIAHIRAEYAANDLRKDLVTQETEVKVALRQYGAWVASKIKLDGYSKEAQNEKIRHASKIIDQVVDFISQPPTPELRILASRGGADAAFNSINAILKSHSLRPVRDGSVTPPSVEEPGKESRIANARKLELFNALDRKWKILQSYQDKLQRYQKMVNKPSDSPLQVPLQRQQSARLHEDDAFRPMQDIYENLRCSKEQLDYRLKTFIDANQIFEHIDQEWSSFQEQALELEEICNRNAGPKMKEARVKGERISDALS
ncbi:hypothetical protein MMC25_001650 [Agyrium rufum]|nr:hypothetical protein [Agyrium rufum]